MEHSERGNMRKLIFALVVAVAVVPAAFAGTGTSPNASQQCVALRTGMGTSSFKQTYGTNANKSNAFGRCVSKIAAADAQATTNAASACRTERSADPTAFKAKYGTNRNKSNAFGNCVSQKAQATEQTEQQATINAARACRTEQKADPAAFKAKYGTNANKSNAFGKCVSQKAHA